VSVLEYQIKEYRRKSKQVTEVFKAPWKLQVVDYPKKCDNCGDITNNEGREFIAIVTTNGIIFYFCTLECLHEFVERELEEQRSKIGGMIV